MLVIIGNIILMALEVILLLVRLADVPKFYLNILVKGGRDMKKMNGSVP